MAAGHGKILHNRVLYRLHWKYVKAEGLNYEQQHLAREHVLTNVREIKGRCLGNRSVKIRNCSCLPAFISVKLYKKLIVYSSLFVTGITMTLHYANWQDAKSSQRTASSADLPVSEYRKLFKNFKHSSRPAKMVNSPWKGFLRKNRLKTECSFVLPDFQ